MSPLVPITGAPRAHGATAARAPADAGHTAYASVREEPPAPRAFVSAHA